jgi:endonuclease/exonuclease/phosphatase family metal-dependent hydrolase
MRIHAVVVAATVLLGDSLNMSFVYYVGGDMNSASAPRAALRQGFAWPTADGPRSTRFGRWDHLLFRGFATVDRAATITSIGDVSDHLPVVTSAMLAGVQPNVALPVK